MFLVDLGSNGNGIGRTAITQRAKHPPSDWSKEFGPLPRLWEKHTAKHYISWYILSSELTGERWLPH